MQNKPEGKEFGLINHKPHFCTIFYLHHLLFMLSLQRRLLRLLQQHQPQQYRLMAAFLVNLLLSLCLAAFFIPCTIHSAPRAC
ncbi:MAG TPA: hypothetical protein DF774_16615 [Rheinheimera sp.]|nr:hypothetical protein [Rheinheimera sp.]